MSTLPAPTQPATAAALDKIGADLKSQQAALEAQLTELDKVLKGRALLVEQLAKVNAMLAQFNGQKPKAPRKPRKDAGTSRGPRNRGANQSAIEATAAQNPMPDPDPQPSETPVTDSP